MGLEAEKSFYARDMAERAGLAKWIDYRIGDALQLAAGEAGPFDFVWLITGKGLYPLLRYSFFRYLPCMPLMPLSFIRARYANSGFSG